MTRLNFNQAPYFDDFDPRKNYIKVLHKPGYAVQGRELNTAQSIMLGQVNIFADHVFKNGSKVSNARSNVLVSNYARLRDLTPDAAVAVNVEQFAEGTVVRGVASGLQGLLVTSVNAENADPATVFISYTNTAVDGVTTEFVPGEDLEFLDANNVVVYKATVRCPGCAGSTEGTEVYPVGRGHIFAIDEGAFYFEGMFLQNPRQQIIVSKYSFPKGEDPQPFAGAKLGFDFVQSVVTVEDDTSLADPSLGYPNATAPGADRYKAELVLARRSYDDEDGENFLLLARMRGDYVTDYIKSDAEYAEIMDSVAKGRYETNGNYTIRPFKLSFYEHKKKTRVDPKGWDINGSEANIVALLSPSVAYVRGYRVESIADTPLLIPKARDTRKLPTFVNRFDERSGITLAVKSAIVWPALASDPNIVGGERVAMYDQVDALGAIIGYARFNDLDKVSGSNAALTAVYRYTVVDLAFTVAGKTLKDVKSFAHAASGFKANTVVSPSSGTFEVTNADANDLVFPMEIRNVKSLRDADNALNGSMSIAVRKKMRATLDSAGTYTFTSTTNEFFESLSSRTVAFTTSGSNVVKTFDLDSTNVNITATSMTVDFGATEAGKTVTVITDVLKTNQKEKIKSLVTHTYTDSVMPSNVAGAKTMLGKADAYSLVKVELYNHPASATPVLIGDVTEYFAINNGATNWFYGESYVTQKSAMPHAITNETRAHVTFQYFEHSGTEGFFTVDSYSDVINDPSNTLTYKDLPVFVSSSGKVVPLSSAIDFRPVMIAGATSGTVPAQGSTALFDCEYYLPRADIIQINKNGVIYPKLGAPSDTPALPVPDADAMVLYHVFLNAYTYSMTDVSMKFIENKRYTMRDIGRLETRIENLEYYTTLSLLEKLSSDMSIKDENGLDRFKNGLIADNFGDFQAADLPNLEFNAAVDRTRKELRPRFKSSGVKLVANATKSENVQWHGGIASLPYISELASENPYATKHISINPYYIFNKKGSVVLSPNVDTWSDETRLPEVVTTIDTGTEALRQIADAAGLLGTTWGSWSAQNSTVIGTQTSQTTQRGQQQINRDGWNVTWQETTNVVNQTQEILANTSTRTGTKKDVVGENQSYTIEDIVKDVQIIPYVRNRVIQFYASNLRANTRIYAYFDGEDVSDCIRGIANTLNNENAAQMLDQIAWGSPVYTDETGAIIGEFNIPAGRFFTGKSEFKLSNDGTGKFDEDMETTSATATYFSGGLDVTKQDSTLNLTTPTLSEQQVSESRTTESTRTVSSEIVSTTVGRTWVQNTDPVAQQFFVDEDQLITGLDIYLQSIDMKSDTIWVELREMVNGYPASGAIARREFKPSQLVASEDSSVPNHIEFYTPVFVQGGGNYCFCVGGASPDTRIWVARLGAEVVNMSGKIVETQPTIGSSFRSQNGVTWNAEQFETIKYRLYRARVTSTTMTVVMENEYEDEGHFILEENPFETELASDLVRVYWEAHGFTENDRVSLSLYDDAPVKIICSGLPPQIGQFIHTDTGSGWIVAVQKDAAGGVDDYLVEVNKTQGRFLKDQVYTADATQIQIRDNFLMVNAGIEVPTMGTINAAVGTIAETVSWGGYIDGKVNGIDVAELSKEHVIKFVDSANSFIVQVTTPAAQSGRSGGAAVKCFDFNLRYETLNSSGSYMPYSSVEAWKFVGTGHGSETSLFAGDNYLEQPEMDVFIGRDQSLERPMKLASKTNESRVFGSSGQKSMKLVGVFTTRNPLLTPLVDTNTFSVTTVTNKVDMNTADEFNVAPNATDRLKAETDPLNGSAAFKYVTKNVRLANPASDLMIYLDYYKDVNADFEVYVKKIPVYEAQPVDSLPWLKVNIETKKNSNTLDDRFEGSYKCSQLVTGWNDSLDDPIAYTAFKVKIVGYARNTAKPPRFQNFRAIAVT